MPIKASAIKGFMVERKGINSYLHKYPRRLGNIEGFNEAIDQQGQKELTLNREGLAKIIYNDMREGFFKLIQPIDNYPSWENADERWRKTAYRQADAIIAKEHELFEVKK